MSDQSHATEAKTEEVLQTQVAQTPTQGAGKTAAPPINPALPFRGGTVASQAATLRRLSGTQRHAMVRHISRVQGNRHVQRVVSAARRTIIPAIQTRLDLDEQEERYSQPSPRTSGSASTARPLPAAGKESWRPTVSRVLSSPGGGFESVHRIHFSVDIPRIARTGEEQAASAEGETGEAQTEGETEELTVSEIPATQEIPPSSLDSVSSSLTFKESIDQGGIAVKASAFGICGVVELRFVNVRIVGGLIFGYRVHGECEYSIKWDVVGTGPRGQKHIANENDPDITAATHDTAVSDLTPNLGDLGGRPPRSKFFAQDITRDHELVHAADYNKFGKQGFQVATAWLESQEAENADGVRTLMEQALDRIIAVVKAGMVKPANEVRAYGAGVADYTARSNAIRKKADKGEYGYLVKAGDNLTKIARRFYNDDSRWEDIYNANKDQIPDRSTIRPGLLLKIPPP